MKFNFHVSPSLKGSLTTQKIMLELTVGLMILFLLSCFYNGTTYGASYVLHEVLLLVSSLVTMFICESIFAKIYKENPITYMKKSFGWVTSIILTLMVPITMTVYALIIATIFAIVFGKLLFGGFGQNIFNPAGVGRAVIFAAFTSAAATGITTGATPTAYLANTFNWLPASAEALDSFLSQYGGFANLALGFYDGALGETFTLAIVLIGIWFCVCKIIDWRVPVVYLGTIFILTAVVAVLSGIDSYHGIPAFIWYPLLHMVTGGIVFGAVFMLTDPVTSPTSAQGRVIFALGAAVITVLLRLKANLPEGCLYSILLMNMFTPMIESSLDGVQLVVKKKAYIMAGCLAILGLAVSFYAATSVEPVTTAATEKTAMVETVRMEETL
ncbi:NADH:ubiquinone oxidoreductase subunit RnfD [Faecalicoccus pleomorphus]|uniref:NADH:ubiquinone oxidoreductase subunit RnfD n=1 Tax=Faecalicoccus pleomorphus TaxID=1323 RepID=A0A3E3DZL0_9FIRM|nr:MULTISPECIES: RnfABCDGE type electron transport complex subunit D [Faecalicoccus]MDY5111120.1 RnfABCDGE type electron transport complex subunit D [Faecalicoccus sp.]RGD74724.1 NADH:ubiquinone oxidoreductase subunit RnfD [Faecalicoccus pleomorphus]